MSMRVIAADARQVEHLGAPLAVRPRREELARGTARAAARRPRRDGRRDRWRPASARETGLPEVLEQHLRVAAAECRVARAAPWAPRRESAPRWRRQNSARADSASTGAPNSRHHQRPDARRAARRHDAATIAGRRSRRPRRARRRRAASPPHQSGIRHARPASDHEQWTTRSTSRSAASRRSAARQPASFQRVERSSRAATRQMPSASHSRALPSIAASAAPPAPTLPRHDVDLDAGLLQRAQHARVIRAVRTGAAQHQRGAALRRIGLHGLTLVVVDGDDLDRARTCGRRSAWSP